MCGPRMMWIGRHEGLLRDVSRGCGYGDYRSVLTGAKILSAFIPDGAILVPMPAHTGEATTMLTLCKAIRGLNGSVAVATVLSCIPHEGMHVAKLRGEYPPPVEMYLTISCDVWSDGLNFDPMDVGERTNVYVIDNCIGTGTTASAALKCLPRATVLAITKG